MKLECGGCEAVLEAEAADDLHAVMMAHSAEVHAVLWEGKSAAEIEQLEQLMAAHVRQMIIDQN